MINRRKTNRQKISELQKMNKINKLMLHLCDNNCNILCMNFVYKYNDHYGTQALKINYCFRSLW